MQLRGMDCKLGEREIRESVEQRLLFIQKMEVLYYNTLYDYTSLGRQMIEEHCAIVIINFSPRRLSESIDAY